jgi:hypothetical protein
MNLCLPTSPASATLPQNRRLLQRARAEAISGGPYDVAIEIAQKRRRKAKRRK